MCRGHKLDRKSSGQKCLFHSGIIGNALAIYRGLSGLRARESGKSLKKVSRGLWPRGPRDFFQTFSRLSGRLSPDFFWVSRPESPRDPCKWPTRSQGYNSEVRGSPLGVREKRRADALISEEEMQRCSQKILALEGELDRVSTRRAADVTLYPPARLRGRNCTRPPPALTPILWPEGIFNDSMFREASAAGIHIPPPLFHTAHDSRVFSWLWRVGGNAQNLAPTRLKGQESRFRMHVEPNI